MHIVIENTEKNKSILGVDSVLRNNAIQARDMVEKGYVKLAGHLHEIHEKRTYVSWGFPTFEDYVDRELSITYSKAQYLVDLNNKIELFNIDPKRLETIGWTKARELLRVVDYDNVEEWLHVAEKCTCRELTVLVREAKEAKNSNKGTTALPSLDGAGEIVRTVKRGPSVTDSTYKTSIVFKVAAIEKAVVKEALEESQRLLDTEDTALALANICQDWLETKGVVPQQDSLEDKIKLLENTYKIKLKVIDADAVIVEEDWDSDNELAPVLDDDEEELFK